MPRRCVVGGCSQTQVPLHTWPKDTVVARGWKKFVDSTRVGFEPATRSLVCCLHFTDDCFENFMAWRLGYGYLKVNSKSIPSIKDPYTNPWKDELLSILKSHGKPVPSIPEHPMKRKRKPEAVDVEGEPSKAQRKLKAARMIHAHKQQVFVHQADNHNDSEENVIGTQTDHLSTNESATQHDVHYSEKAVQSFKTQFRSKCTMTKKPSVTSRGVGTFGLVTVRSVAVQLDPIIEEEEEPEEIDEDSVYEPPRQCKSATDIKGTCAAKEVVLVCMTNLMQLLAVCAYCAGPATVTEHKQRIGAQGTYFAAKMVCTSCSRERFWENQPCIRAMPLLNLVLSSAIFISGSAISKALRLFDFMHVRHISESTVYRHAKQYIVPHILSTWNLMKQTLMADIQQEGRLLTLLGDARSDSPGHSAKFGTYTLMDALTGRVIAMEQVQSTEVASSYHCEREGLERALAFVDVSNIRKLITDRHRQIAKWLRENVPNVVHLFDVWHVAKGLNKKLLAAAKQRDCQVIERWRQSIINHLYWCAKTTPDNNEELMAAKWESVMNHVTDNHDEFNNHLFPECQHEPIVDDYEWIEVGSKAATELEKIVCATGLVNDIKKLSSSAQTSSLESFHSVMLMFTPKSTAYSYVGMKARSALAAIHWNWNVDRGRATDAEGRPRYAIVFPKAKKGEPAVKQVKKQASYGYAEDLISALLEAVEDNIQIFEDWVEEVDGPMPALADQYQRPQRDQIIAAFRTRFQH